ncbi:MAG: hypothetical protein DCO99_00720 [Synechococcus sp. XM-24]|nr:MAG: hypothetical protein DCO99_00720 [Synechococcus sp. XM-24]
MIHLQSSVHSFEATCERMAEACQTQGYGVLAQHNVGDTLRAKGIDYSGQCIVFEICQPSHAAAILKADATLASGLPCRMAVSQQGSEPVSLSMFSPEQLLREASSKEAIQRIGAQVQQETLRIMELVAH